MSESHFSTTYADARRRFHEAADAAGARVTSYGIQAESHDELAMDVAVLGSNDAAPTVVTSSGVHGVEGFFASAIQHALLKQLRNASDADHIRYVLIHAVNPYGFSQLRRGNEDNVDLNRNFLSNATDYQGAPKGYADLNGFLNPESPPSRFEVFKLKALWNIWRHGLQSVKQSVAGGQYEYPRGLFFGGRGPCQSTQIVHEHCDSWIGASRDIVHIDFHSGLGEFGSYKLLLAEDANSKNYSWYCHVFGSDSVEAFRTPDGTAYAVSGLFGEWMQRHFSSRKYRFVAAEFGTYDVIRVLGAIRAENRAHHYCSEQSATYRSAKDELLECFCPKETTWRKQVVDAGLRIIEQAADALR